MFQDLPEPEATEAQKYYIERLLDLLFEDLSDRTDKELNKLTLDEASDLIDELKEDVTFYELWPED